MIRHAPRETLLALLLASTTACSSDEADTTAVEGGAFRCTASGETLALHGYDFPPTAGQEAFLVDGWELSFEKALVVIDHVHLNSDPDRAPTDQSQTGSEIARLEGGPFAVNLAEGGVGTVAGKGSEDRAWPLGTITEQDDGKPFDPAERYAISYGFVAATEAATRLGILDDDDDYDRMVENGWTHLLIGTATRQRPTSECTTTGDFDYASLPEQVRLELGFAAVVTNTNCQNPELTGQPISDTEESQRGVQAKANETVDVQLTLHIDHLFWNTLAHGAVPQFNHFAALAKEVDGTWTVTLEDLEGAPLIAPAADTSGNDLGWMSCVDSSDYQLPTQPIFTFDTEGQPIEDVHEFVIANASTMGHLNQDGLCYVAGFAHEHGE